MSGAKPVELLMMSKRDHSADYVSSFGTVAAAEKAALKRFAAWAANYPMTAWESVYVITEWQGVTVYVGIPDESGSDKRGREWSDAIRSGEIAPRRLRRTTGFGWEAEA